MGIDGSTKSAGAKQQTPQRKLQPGKFK